MQRDLVQLNSTQFTPSPEPRSSAGTRTVSFVRRKQLRQRTVSPRCTPMPLRQLSHSLLLPIVRSLNTVLVTPAAGHADHVTGCECHEGVSRVGARIEGHGTVSEVLSSLEPGNVSPNSSYTYGLTVRCRRLPELQVERPILITTMATYYKTLRLCGSKSIQYNTVSLASTMM